jgi:methyl-accepting chemotaxis protein
VDSAGRTMQDIVQQVRGVTDLAGEISRSTQEQSSGIGQVNQAVTQLDQVTQQNAALVQQSAEAAESLSNRPTAATGRGGFPGQGPAHRFGCARAAQVMGLMPLFGV